MKKYIIFIVVILLLIGCSNSKKKDEFKTDVLKFKAEYEKLNNRETNYNDKKYRELKISDNNPFIYKEAKDIIDMIDNKETFAVYFGFSSCPWCRSIIPSLIDVSNDLYIDTIYYVDIKEG